MPKDTDRKDAVCKDAVCKDAVCVNGGRRNGSRAKCGHACKTDGGGKLRRLAVTAVLSALGAIPMYFPKLTLPFMPSFISLDFSDLPALLAAYSMGPLSGVTVCLVKNLVSLLGSMTGGGRAFEFYNKRGVRAAGGHCI